MRLSWFKHKSTLNIPINFWNWLQRDRPSSDHEKWACPLFELLREVLALQVFREISYFSRVHVAGEPINRRRCSPA